MALSQGAKGLGWGAQMTLMQVNAGQGFPAQVLDSAAALAAGAPLIVMLHGYRYSPSQSRHDPHRHILALDPAGDPRHVQSWPRGLGFADPDADPAQGLAIAFGWEARGTLTSVYRRAGRAGADLAGLIAALSRAAERPVAVIAHSMGARVALSALHHLPAGAMGRAVLLAGAEFRCAAGDAIVTPAGAAAEIVNIMSRQNDAFDLGLELMLSGLRRQALGRGLAQAAPNWIDIQIDDEATLRGLETLGFAVQPVDWRPSHWSPYLRDGVFDFYRAALRTPRALPLSLLRSRLLTEGTPRRSFAVSLRAHGQAGMRA